MFLQIIVDRFHCLRAADHVFHTTLGHDVVAMNCQAFATTTLRGTEWAATGKVTIPVPKDFPTDTTVVPLSYLK